ncbi:MAG: hypothetical protein KC777_03130 [Cyanobacteria bacterium HKST-UBA02]|nr:hypothetical protein [Cyanobacteria bacterium HKST-UBA02]
MKFFYSIILAGIIVWLGSASFTYLPLLFRSGGLATVISGLNAALLVIPIVAGAIAAVILFRILNKNLIARASRKVTITSAGVFLVVMLFALGLGYGIYGCSTTSHHPEHAVLNVTGT